MTKGVDACEETVGPGDVPCMGDKSSLSLSLPSLRLLYVRLGAAGSSLGLLGGGEDGAAIAARNEESSSSSER